MKSYTSNNPEFSENIIIPETTDTNHADNINSAPKQLLQNTLENKNKILAIIDELSKDDDDLIEVDITEYTSIVKALNDNAKMRGNGNKVICAGNYYYTDDSNLKQTESIFTMQKKNPEVNKLPPGASNAGIILVREIKDLTEVTLDQDDYCDSEYYSFPYYNCFLICNGKLFATATIPRILINAYTKRKGIVWKMFDSDYNPSGRATYTTGVMFDENGDPIIDEETNTAIMEESVGDTEFASVSATSASHLNNMTAPGVYYITGLNEIRIDPFNDLTDGILTVFRYDQGLGVAKFRQTVQGTDSRNTPRTIVRDGWLDYDAEKILSQQYTEWVDAAIENPLKEIKEISPSSLTGFQKFTYGGTSSYAGISFPSAYHFCEGFCCTLTFGENWKKIRMNPFELNINVSELNGYLSLCRGCLKGSTYSIEQIKLDEMTININNFCQISSGTLGDSTHQHEGTAVCKLSDGKYIDLPISVRIEINDQSDQFHMFVYVYFNQMALGAVFDGTYGEISGKLPLFTYLSNLGDYMLSMFNNTSSYTLRFYE